MPIVENGDTIHFEYQIPGDIDSRIPEYFYYAMAGELCSIFGLQVLLINEDGFYNFNTGTSGWYEAFSMTCKKLEMDWFSDYYFSLEWYDSDLFDGIIEDRIVEKFIKCSDQCCNEYYRYLLERKQNGGQHAV